MLWYDGVRNKLQEQGHGLTKSKWVHCKETNCIAVCAHSVLGELSPLVVLQEVPALS